MASTSLPVAACVLVFVALSLAPAPANSRSMNSPTMNEIPSRFNMAKNKRPAAFDPACRGVFDPDLYKKLDAVCNDCFYLYYDETLTTRCRSDCFMNDAFRYCTVDMLYPEEEYVSIARKLHSKAG